jgi:ubiquinone/menaquinone biosynthesis C-methylase UbiE
MTQQHERPYLPGMGRHALLPLYDPLTRLVGARAMHQRLLDQADLRPGLRVLEVGCGTGNLAVLAARQQPGSTVRGLDPDPRALARAAAKAGRAGLPIGFDRGYADQLPYPSGSVDRVLSSLMFHHLDQGQRPAALAEIARVLAPGGSLHVVDLTGPPRHRLRRRHSHRHGHDGPELATLLGAAGLRDARETGHGTNPLGSYTFYRADR